MPRQSIDSSSLNIFITFIGNFVVGVEKGTGECVGKDGSTIKCGGKVDTQVKDFSGKDIRNISVIAKKWVRVSQYENNTKKGKRIIRI